MLSYVLTAMAGVAIGIVAMRVWLAREPAPAQPAGAGAESPEPGAPATLAPGFRPSPRHALLGAAAMAVVAGGILATRDDGAPAASRAMPALPPAGAPGKAIDDVDTMIGRLAARLEKNPTDGEGYRMLAWSYAMTGRPDQAIAPYRRALALLPNSALVHSGYGEALAGMAGNKVTPEARVQFERAVALDPAEPRARYFLALWQAQNGAPKPALEAWIRLANSGPADAPWQTDVRRKIDEVAGQLGVDVKGRIKAAPAVSSLSSTMPPALDSATIQAANAMPAQDRQAMVDQMVGSLAGKLKADPRDADRWVLLLRSRMVLKQSDQAAADLAAARKALAGDAASLSKINAAAREFGIPGA